MNLINNKIITIPCAIILMLNIGIMGSSSWARDGEIRHSALDSSQISAPKIYTIYNISMDETASSSRKASSTALKKAQRIALEKLFRKIIREEDHKQLPKLSDGQVMELVSGIEVANEKSSHVRYIADFTVHFSRDKIYNFLSELQLPFAETLSRPVSILTVLEKGGAVVLWEKNNEWRDAWTGYDTVNNLVPIEVVGASLTNRMAITAWQAQRGGRDVLDKFSDQRGLRKLYVMSAQVENNLTEGSRMLVLRIFSNGEEAVEFKKTIAVENRDDDLSELYDEAIKQATYWLDNQWKEKVMIHFGSSSHLMVNIKYDQHEDWFEIKKRLESISLIRKVTYRAFKMMSAEIDMEHSGDVEQIILTLEQEDLILANQSENMPEVMNGIMPETMNAPVVPSWVLTLKK